MVNLVSDIRDPVGKQNKKMERNVIFVKTENIECIHIHINIHRFVKRLKLVLTVTKSLDGARIRMSCDFLDWPNKNRYECCESNLNMTISIERFVNNSII